MADPIIQTAEQQITCTICFDIFDQPKSLPCLHTFCKKCIADHILNHAQFARRMGYNCPICRGFVLAPSGKEFSPHLWVESLPSNHNVVSMISAYKTPRPCYLNPCSNHPNKELEFYCVDHDVYICSLCSLQHRKCDEVLEREEAEELPRRVAPSTDNMEERYITFLFDQCNDIEHLIDSRREIINHMNQSESDIRCKITTRSQNAVDLIKYQEEKAVGQLTKIKSKEIHRIESDIRKCEKVNEKCKKALQSLQTARDHDDPEEINDTLERVKEEYEQNKKKIQDLSKKRFKSKMDYKTDTTIDAFLSDFKSFGTIECVRDDGIPNTPSTISTEAFTPPTQSQRYPRQSKSATSRRYEASPTSSCPSFQTRGNLDDRPRTTHSQRIRSASSIDVSEQMHSGLFHTSEDAHLEVTIQNNRSAWITGIAVLNNGYLVIVDHSNESIMLYDTTYVKISDINVTPQPYDIVAISNSELLATRPDVDNILAINVYGEVELKYGASIQTGFKAKSISHDNNHFVVCNSDRLQIYIKHNGQWRKHDEHAFDRTKLTYVAVDGTKERIFVTDQKYPEPELFCMSYDGDIKWRLIHQDLGFPSGLVICNGYIYTASWDKGSVLRISYDGSFDGTDIQRGIQFPWKLTVTPRHDKLLLSQHKNTLSSEARRIVRFFFLNVEM